MNFEPEVDDDTFLTTPYEPKAVDPGWTFTFVVIIICISINVMLPFFLICAKRRDNLRDEEWERKRNSNTLNHDVWGDAKSVSEESNAAVSYVSAAKSAGAVSTVSAAKSTSASTVISEVASKVLENRRATKTNRGHYHTPRKRGRRPTPKKKTNNAQGDDDNKSVMSKLDQDAVSVSDAVDAEDKGTAPKQYSYLTSEERVSLFEKLLIASTWDKEMKKLVSLWIPYTIAGASDGFFQIINVGIISHFIGVNEANAYVVVIILVEFTATFTYGWGGALGVLGPQAHGVGNELLIGRYVQLGIIFTALASIPGILIWCFWAKDAVLLFGFDEETASMAQAYVYPLLFVVLVDGAFGVVLEFLEFTGHERYSTFAIVMLHSMETLGLVVTAAVNVKDLMLLGVVQAFIALVVSLCNMGYILYKGWFDDYWEGVFVTNGLKDKKAVANMVKTAIPLCLSYILTYGEWEVMTIFAGYMGPYEVAAWGIVGFLWDTFEYIINGLSEAAEVRVGFRMGGGEIDLAKAASYKSMYLGFVVSVYGTGILYAVSGHLPGWLTPDPTLKGMIFSLLPLMGFGQVSMSMGMVCWNILGAQGRVRLATTMEFIVSWLIVMPVAALLVYVFKLNLLSMVGTLVVGYTIGCVAIMYFLFRSDWESLSAKVITRNGGTVSYDEYDWDDLPRAVQEAAIVLGYDSNIWEGEEEPPSGDKDWDELTVEERRAAKRLGFNQETWDNDESGETLQSRSSGETKTYDHLSWAKLPPEAQQAAKVLGYTSQMWNNDKEPKSAEKSWNRLTSKEQAAASKLGYNKEKWDDDEDDSSEFKLKLKTEVVVTGSASPSATAIPASNSLSPSIATKDESKAASAAVCYDDYSWRKLPQEIQEAAMVLGYDKKMWDTDKEPKTCDKSWNKLTSKEQEAAAKLGYNKEKWDDDGSDSSEDEVKPAILASKQDSVSPSTAAAAVSYDDYSWRKLPQEIQEAAMVLGYDKKMWDTDKEPDTCDKYWNDLTPREQAAAKKLGYNEQKWNDDCSEAKPESANKPVISSIKQASFSPGTSSKKVSISPSTVNKDESKQSAASVSYDDYSWRKLPQGVREAAMILGYDKKMWDTDKEPDTCDKYWKDLTPREQAAAKKLGYNEQMWNDDGTRSEDKPARAKKPAVSASKQKSISSSAARNNNKGNWQKLPREIKEAATVLGCTQEMWDADDEPNLCKKHWNKLTPKEQEAAKKLGFSKQRWNDCVA